ncbi:Cyclohexadienyl dehydrogenase -specific [Georgfuchsia toluolica]|uniref:prephenate dehydrogenase n=1 Tax=Georgfuchsia toluolica TaxID=424218 RepID=A0A916J3C7_9PROT|nr:prephenate dehydrogenase/arogenate dehydrogenase family protein [Georgfuchsia toluolica]CAG4883424.1 Cyclohexadienyl dehydrogenase -specific [Georgfuchsia toluolica]
MVKLNKIVIAGVGLIGGSFALALKQAGAVREVVGIGRTRATLERAKQLGVIDAIADDWAGAMQGADLVLLAMPVGAMEAALQALLPHLEAHTVVTDGGSTKRDILQAAERILGARVAQFVPGHPIAGSEKGGAAAAQADLYRDRRVVLTPGSATGTDGLALVRTAWEACGAKVDILSTAAHDRVFAAVSHLPHLLAYALVHEFAARDNAGELFGFAAGGFRDFTRIASSHPEMWRDICIVNRAPLIAELDAYMAALLRLRTLLAAADANGLEAVFAAARQARDEWLHGMSENAEE